MSVPNDLLYTKSHEWVRIEGDEATMGITHHAQDQLGEVVFVEMPDTEIDVAAGDELGSLESVKAVADFFAPVTGSVVDVNARLEDEPELVNTDPYGEGWLVKLGNAGEPEGLLSPDDYEAFLAEEQS
jgi:glycine cleavage system H protein